MQQIPSLPRPSDRWIPWYFVAFFILLISILVPMGIIAVRTNTGLVTESAYNKGLAYNASIRAEEAQKALGWHGDLTITPAGNKIHADYLLSNSEGKPLNGANAKLWFVRPTQAGMDQNFTLHPNPDGHYVTEIALPAHGLWEARVSVTIDNQNYQTIKRVVIP